jgi:hypothetical protein
MIFHQIKAVAITVIVVLFLVVPIIVYGQHYIIEDIPDYGDDGLRPTVTEGQVSGGSQEIIEDVKTDVITTIEKTTTTTTTVTENIQENKTSIHTMSLIGTLSGATMVLASTAVPLFATTPTMIQDLMFLNFFGFLTKRKNEKRWGVVFDVDTKLPIPAVKITLFDKHMKELETTYSNKEGRFGFLAGEGVYKVDAYKKNYVMSEAGDNDEIYGNLYVGGDVEVKGDKILGVNIALKSTIIDWKKYAEEKAKQYGGTGSLVKKYLFTTFYFIGFIATIIITIVYPSILNIVLVSINVIFFIIIYFIKKKDHGTVMTDDKKPVPFAVVNLYNEETGKKDAFAVTDVIGRYYMLANEGNYTVKATGQSIGGDRKEVEESINIKDGIVSEDIVFE